MNNEDIDRFAKLATFVAERHVSAGQHSYWSAHLEPIGHQLPPHLYASGIGHDVLEDTDATPKDLLDAGFTPREIEVIQLLTKREGEDLESYIGRVRTDPDAVRIKLVDVMNNVSRLYQLPETERLRLQRKYRFTLQLLCGVDPV